MRYQLSPSNGMLDWLRQEISPGETDSETTRSVLESGEDLRTALHNVVDARGRSRCQFLQLAEGKLASLRSAVRAAHRRDFLSKSQFQKVSHRLEQIRRMIAAQRRGCAVYDG